MTPLCHILQPCAPRVMAYRHHAPLWLAAWQTHVTALTHFLQAQPARNWLLAEDDRYHFLTGLMALLAAGKYVLIPPNTQDGTLAACAHHASALLGNATVHRGGMPIAMGDNNIQPNTQTTQATPLVLDPQARITLMTSGSTGAPKYIDKTVAQLAAELHALEQQWGAALADSTVIATVPHQHIYGLLFSVLWPVCSHRPFAVDTHAYPETVLSDIQHWPRVALVSSPAQLSRFPTDTVDACAANSLCRTFSSGGPLSVDAALTWQACTGHAPTEVFGSTETGGIAWRQQTQRTPEQDWQPLPSVQCHCDAEQQLLVSSPWFSPDQPAAMGDRASHTTDGRFLLLGRADRIVKVMEKRVSLTALEQHLLLHAGVHAARVLPLPDQNRLGAVVVPSPAGLTNLQTDGKRAFAESLRTHLLHVAERVVLPRKWRFPTALPINAQGKTTEADLLSLFTMNTTLQHPGVTFTQEHADDTQQRWRIALAHDASVFDGHFPDLPILPGVIQLDIAVRACAAWHAPQHFRSVEKLKFQEPAVPGDTITLHLTKHTDNAVAFHYTLDGRSLSSGVVVFQV